MLYDRWIDFVNLRSETYELDSRIPDKMVRQRETALGGGRVQPTLTWRSAELRLGLGAGCGKQEFGTPEQDAYRRDITINALFYNIQTGAVEDLTQQVRL